MRLKILLPLILLSAFAYASHNRGGYINYYNVGGNMYKFRIYTWTDPMAAASDRCDLILYIDCTDSLVCNRINGVGSCPNGGSGVDGVVLIPGSVKENIYEGGPYMLTTGTHIFTVIDFNRHAGIINLGGSSSQNMAFAIIDTFYVYNMSGMINNSVLINYRPIDIVCAGQQFNYNAGMVDPDNDSLDYSIVRSFADDPNSPNGCVQQIASEIFPAGLTVDKFTGLLSWSVVSNMQGDYDISILIKEYKISPTLCKRLLVSATVLDIPLHVVPCANSNIVFSGVPQNACVTAGTNYLLQLNASSSGTITQPVDISAVGLPITMAGIGANATFTSASSATTASGNFYWGTTCQAVQNGTYPVTFRTFDAGLPARADYKTQFVKIVAPPPTNLMVNGVGNNAYLNWTAPLNCGQTSGNTLFAYDIYRIDSCVNFVPSSCQTSAPQNFLNIGTVLASSTTFTDSNIPTGPHTYIVIARFSDCSASLTTAGVCGVTGIADNFLNENISLWPNPANGFVYLTSSLQGAENLKITFTNALGETVFSKAETVSAKTKIKYDVSQFAKGVYFVRISNGDKNVVKKIIVE